MENSFTLKLPYCKGNKLPKIIHSRNGELLHDCYYDLDGFNGKAVILSNLQLYENIENQIEKGVGNKSQTCFQIFKESYGPEAEIGLVEYDNYLIDVFKLNRGHHLEAYVDWIRSYFDACVVF